MSLRGTKLGYNILLYNNKKTQNNFSSFLLICSCFENKKKLLIKYVDADALIDFWLLLYFVALHFRIDDKFKLFFRRHLVVWWPNHSGAPVFRVESAVSSANDHPLIKIPYLFSPKSKMI